jgi:Family of unknown function (DUF6279)
MSTESAATGVAGRTGLAPAFSGLRTLAATGRVLALLALAGALTLASGCAMVQMGYTHLDTLAAWKADEYFDLDPQQKQEFRARFERLHEWHRREQLPEYVVFLTETKSRLSKQPAREDIVWIAEGLKSRYRVMARRAAPDAAALLATLRPEQLAAAQKQWDDDNRRFNREYRLKAGVEDLKRARAERALDEIRKWTSHLTPDQERAIAAMSDRLPAISQLRLDDRIRRQREFRQLLELRTSGDFQQRLTRFLLDWESGRAPEYDRVLTEWWEMRQDYFIALYRLLTPEQRTAVLKRLQHYIDDFARLSERPAQSAKQP